MSTPSLILDCSASTVTQAAPDTLQMTWRVAFTDALAGKRHSTVVQVLDTRVGDSGQVAVGSLAVNRPPQLVSLSSSSGGQGAGVAQSFRAIFDDPDAVDELNTVELRLEYPYRTLAGSNDVVLRYIQKSGLVGIANEDGKTFQLSRPGEARLLTTTLARLDCARTQAVVQTFFGQPSTLSVSWAVTPAQAAAGTTYSLWLRAIDDLGAQTGPGQFGTWSVSG